MSGGPNGAGQPPARPDPKEILDFELAAVRQAWPEQLAARLWEAAARVDIGVLGREEVIAALSAAAVDRGLPEETAREIVVRGIAGLRRPSPGERGDDDDDDRRPVIRMRASRLDEAVAALDGAFELAGPGPIFQRGGDLAHVARRPARRDNGAVEEQEAIAPVTAAALRAAACRVARFERFDRRDEEFRPIDPPKPVIEAFQSAPRWRGIRDLVQCIGSPTLRRDGSLLSAPGYDPATGLYLTRALAISVPERPTAADAQRANDELASLFSSFQFADPEETPGLGLSVSMAATIAAILRPSLSAAPAVAITAPAPGTGKSYLANVIAAAATGERAVAVSTGTKPEEFEKALGAALLAGRPLISLDNMTLPLGGQLLNMILTERDVVVRILGLSKDVRLPAAPAVLATGNNLRILGDTSRRTLMIRLDAETERPEQRTFDTDPLSEAFARRPEIVSAALTIARWNSTEGNPAPPRSFAGFDDWTARVRAPLIALGHPDPANAVDLARSTDDVIGDLRTLAQQWLAALGDQPVTTNEAIDRAFLVETMSGKRVHPEFAAAVAAVTRDAEGRPRDGRRLGKYLAAVEGRIIDDLRFVRAGQFRRAVKWLLEKMEGFEA